MGITGYTENIFKNYKGDEFLKLFQHYSKLMVSEKNKENTNLNEESGNQSSEWLNSKNAKRKKPLADSNAKNKKPKSNFKDISQYFK